MGLFLEVAAKPLQVLKANHTLYLLHFSQFKLVPVPAFQVKTCLDMPQS